MGSSYTSMAFRSSSKRTLFILSVSLLSFSLLILTGSLRKTTELLCNSSPKPEQLHPAHHLKDKDLPLWLKVIQDERKDKRLNVGFVNIDNISDPEFRMNELVTMVKVNFDRVPENLHWENLFPRGVDEDEKLKKPSCPKIPMPRFEDYHGLDAVVARSPCGSSRDVFRLQVNLVVANLAVESGQRIARVVFIGVCGPMVEIFRCDDLVRRVGDYWVYKPDQRRLMQKALMPVGSCQLASTHAETDGQRRFKSQSPLVAYRQREAYATVLHSSQEYVCGAIALAHSIRRTNSTRDLVVLVDDSISSKSLAGLRTAGWRIRHIQRIRSPTAKKGAYNEWNYSKLRLWQLTEYDKIIFIDADLIVLRNIDQFFVYPQLSAAQNENVIFNSGIMVIEPSYCVFKELMSKSLKLGSYNGGDQGFLNEFFTWWHRLPRRLNYMKYYTKPRNGEPEIPDDLYALHYLGLKPWMCYRDYDCNWDIVTRHIFANDKANRLWWEVYDSVPTKLQSFCGLTEKMDARIRKWRSIAKRANLANGRWKIKVKDSRRRHYVG